MSEERNIRWVDNKDAPWVQDIFVGEKQVGWMTRRPAYCDRGHWQVNIELPMNIDAADCFPRYYMRREAAVQETELFLKWRLWKERAEH